LAPIHVPLLAAIARSPSPTALLSGFPFVAACGYLAAVYLAAVYLVVEAGRRDDRPMRAYLTRCAQGAAVAAVAAGALSLDRDLDEQRGAATGRAGHVERASDRLDAVAEPGQTRPPGGIGSADPVVADRQPQGRVGCV
jgi:hypothetical protein